MSSEVQQDKNVITLRCSDADKILIEQLKQHVGESSTNKTILKALKKFQYLVTENNRLSEELKATKQNLKSAEGVLESIHNASKSLTKYFAG